MNTASGDLLIRNIGWLVTMNPAREVLREGRAVRRAAVPPPLDVPAASQAA